MDAVYWAGVNAPGIFHSDARFCNDVCHNSLSI
jgi:hypothetical protein